MPPPEQRDADLKRYFEEGLSHPTVRVHLQLHAPDADFATTVLKARAFVEAHEGAKPKKCVRIITPPPDHTTPVDLEEDPSILQPLLQGFRDVLKEHFPPASVQQINRDPSPGNTDNAGRDRDSRRDDRPNNRSKNDRNRSQSPANNNNSNRPPRDGPTDSGNFRPGYNRPQSPAPNGQQPSGNYQNRYRSPSPAPYRNQQQPFRNQSPYRGPPQQFRSQSPAPRWQQRSQTPPPRWPDRRPGTPPPAGYRDYQL